MNKSYALFSILCFLFVQQTSVFCDTYKIKGFILEPDAALSIQYIEGIDEYPKTIQMDDTDYSFEIETKEKTGIIQTVFIPEMITDHHTLAITSGALLNEIDITPKGNYIVLSGHYSVDRTDETDSD